MTYSDLMAKATAEQRKEVRARVEKIIGKKELAVLGATDLTEKIRMAQKWEKAYEQLAKVFLEHGEKALALNFMSYGRSSEGVTASGKKWVFTGNNGFTDRSRYCGDLYIEGEGTVFTSGRIDKVFDYILNA